MGDTLVELFALSIPIAAILGGICIAVLAMYFEYKKKKAMIEKGLIPEDEKHRPEDRLGWGIVILGIGISLVISWIFDLNDKVMVGLILASIGIALLASYMVSHKKD